MNDLFLRGFARELMEHGLLKSAAPQLGQKVTGAVKRIAKRSEGIRARTKGGSGLKGVTKVAEYGDFGEEDEEETDMPFDESDAAGDTLRAIVEEAQARMNNAGNDQGYNDQLGGGVSYGTGGGMHAAPAAGAATPHNRATTPPPPKPQPVRTPPPRVALKPGQAQAPIVRKGPPTPPPRRLPQDLD